MSANGSEPLVEVEGLVVRYPVPRGLVGTIARRPRRSVHAVDGVTFSLRPGEILALVGESGCGKTTTAQAVLRLVDPVSGAIRFDGRDLVPLGSRELRPLRRRIQVVYQDPYESLDPRFRVRAVVEEPPVAAGRGATVDLESQATPLGPTRAPAESVTRTPAATVMPVAPRVDTVESTVVEEAPVAAGPAATGEKESPATPPGPAGDRADEAAWNRVADDEAVDLDEWLGAVRAHAVTSAGTSFR